jgi:hypothetical protein
MATPYWKYPGTLEGRIDPSQVEAEDGTYVFCLGEDAGNLSDRILGLNDEISIEQSVDLTGEDLVRFRWNIRTGILPSPRTLVSAGDATFKTSALMYTGDSLQGVDIAVAGFVPGDRDRWCRVSGTTNNNADFRVSAVPATQTRPTDGQVMTVNPAGRLAVLEGAVTAETPSAATIKMLGLRWLMRLEVAETEIFSFAPPSEQIPMWRQTLAANVSKLTGSQLIKFILKLENYE